MTLKAIQRFFRAATPPMGLEKKADASLALEVCTPSSGLAGYVVTLKSA